MDFFRFECIFVNNICLNVYKTGFVMSLFLLNVKDLPRTETTHQPSFPKNHLLILLHVSDVDSRSDLIKMAAGSRFDPQKSLEVRGVRRLVAAVSTGAWHIDPLYTRPADHA